MSQSAIACDIRYLNRNSILPQGLSHDQLIDAMNHSGRIVTGINRYLVEEGLPPLTELIQANNFSGIVSNILTKAMDIHSDYKDNHDQRYPDLINRISADSKGLEVKAAKKASKGGESHNGHSGWHLIASYHILDNQLKFTCLKFADLVGFEKGEIDWKYQGSQRNENNS